MSKLQLSPLTWDFWTETDTWKYFHVWLHLELFHSWLHLDVFSCLTLLVNHHTPVPWPCFHILRSKYEQVQIYIHLHVIMCVTSPKVQFKKMKCLRNISITRSSRVRVVWIKNFPTTKQVAVPKVKDPNLSYQFINSLCSRWNSGSMPFPRVFAQQSWPGFELRSPEQFLTMITVIPPKYLEKKKKNKNKIFVVPWFASLIDSWGALWVQIDANPDNFSHLNEYYFNQLVPGPYNKREWK